MKPGMYESYRDLAHGLRWALAAALACWVCAALLIWTRLAHGEFIWSLLQMLEFGYDLKEIGICELKDAWL